MIQVSKLFLVVLISGCFWACADENSGKETAHSGSAYKIEHNENGTGPKSLELPEHLLTMLRLEMQQIDSAMGRLLSSLAQGNVEEAVQVAEQIHDTFILKQRLSQQDLKQLIGLLPPEFIKLDREFHGNAKKTAEAVKGNDFDTAIRLYSEMTQSCVTCHKQYALTRYPNLK